MTKSQLCSTLPPLLLVLLLAVAVECRRPKMHYHRYMLSEYRPQHNPHTQMDYLRHKPPVYPVEEPKMRSGRLDEPLIQMTTSHNNTVLHELLVRIYQRDNYLCMGTLISEQLILTAATCFINVHTEELHVKTYTDKLIDVYPKNNTEGFVLSNDTLLTILQLKEPINDQNSNLMNDMATLCNRNIKPHQVVELPTYIRSAKVVRTMATEVVPLEQCRKTLNDINGNMVGDSVICVKNMKQTRNCQNTFGTPLIYQNMICGVNVMGHNCPKAYGIDLYASVFSATDYVRVKFDAVREANLEESIL